MNNEIITGHPDRNWDEDFLHENGNYVNNCVSCRLYFRGHKRRVICKKCSSTPDPVKEDETSGQRQSLAHEYAANFPDHEYKAARLGFEHGFIAGYKISQDVKKLTL
jgi:hypothetical protein